MNSLLGFISRGTCRFPEILLGEKRGLLCLIPKKSSSPRELLGEYAVRVQFLIYLLI